MFNIRVYNNIADIGLERFGGQYHISTEAHNPDAILLRSYNLTTTEIPESVIAVGRAGAGVNNIPVQEMTPRGIPVFNTPGANANAVNELVLAGLLLSSRNLIHASRFIEQLNSNTPDFKKAIEEGKKQFQGIELPGRTLGVVGLGAIGVKVANAAYALGMRVVGYDPQISVKNAWQLSANIIQADSLECLYHQAEFLTVHVPLTKDTQAMINADTLRQLPKGATLLNFSRDEIVDEQAVIHALDNNILHNYVTDFPSGELKGHPKVISLPHLGASTKEAEDNCAMMVVDQIKNYLETGNITHAVNFPEAQMPLTQYTRVAIVNANVPNMLAQISSTFGNAKINIIDMLNKSCGEIAYTLIDVENHISDEMVKKIRGIEGILRVRVIGK
jgi:D-3-phosphoglycerate dehydrogenase